MTKTMRMMVMMVSPCHKTLKIMTMTVTRLIKLTNTVMMKQTMVMQMTKMNKSNGIMARHACVPFVAKMQMMVKLVFLC